MTDNWGLIIFQVGDHFVKELKKKNIPSTLNIYFFMFFHDLTIMF